jgi:hypothetical protein
MLHAGGSMQGLASYMTAASEGAASTDPSAGWALSLFSPASPPSLKLHAAKLHAAIAAMIPAPPGRTMELSPLGPRNAKIRL